MPLRSPSVAWEELDGEAVLYDDATGAMHRLNASATAIWVCCDGSAPLRELIAELSEAFRAHAEAIEQEVITLVGDLAGRGLIELTGGDRYRTDSDGMGCDEESA
jgi:PqqD family protein of HPr-rel-A system